MAACPCPKCKTPASGPVETIRSVHGLYYLCWSCGHIWLLRKADAIALTHDVEEPVQRRRRAHG